VLLIFFNPARVAFYWLPGWQAAADGKLCSGPSQIPIPEHDGAKWFFSNYDRTKALKLIGLPVKMLPKTEYLVTFTVQEIRASEPVVLEADLVGENYQSEERKVRIPLMPGTKDRKITEAIYSGRKVPQAADLRIYFSDAAEITLGDINVIGLRKNTQRIFICCALGCLLAIGGLFRAIYRQDPRSFSWLRGLTRAQRNQLAFVAVFFGLLLAPALQQAHKLFHYKPVEENRRMMDKPEGYMLLRLFSDGPDYSKAYEKYFNDLYGFRDFFIKCKNQLDYTIFSRSDKVMIGKSN
jgi:hypothetical protein